MPRVAPHVIAYRLSFLEEACGACAWATSALQRRLPDDTSVMAVGDRPQELAALEWEWPERFECTSVLPAAYDPLSREGPVKWH